MNDATQKKAESKANALADSLEHRLTSFAEQERAGRTVRVAKCMYCELEAIVGPGAFTRSGKALIEKCEHGLEAAPVAKPKK